MHRWRARIEDLHPQLPRVRLQASELQDIQTAIARQQCGAWETVTQTDETPQSMLLAIPTSLDPNSPKAQFFPQRYAMLQLSSLKPAPRRELFALYSKAAGFLQQKGIGVHRCSVYAAQQELAETWSDLGFARYHCHAVRSMEDLAPFNLPPRVRLRPAGISDRPALEQLFRVLAAQHHTPAMAITPPPAAGQIYAGLEQELAAPRVAHFIAELDGDIIGYIDGYTTVHGEGYLAPLTGEPFLYIRNCSVAPARQGMGVGTALLHQLLEWGRCSIDRPRRAHLDYRTANIPGSSFWCGHGFNPLLYGLLRVSQQPKKRGLFGW
ncbi:GNAT family N-acetyltransferase [Spirochaeta africana]|nr:GNAT family N-acetyltransferase [Spirochaeta africana]